MTKRFLYYVTKIVMSDGPQYNGGIDNSTVNKSIFSFYLDTPK